MKDFKYNRVLIFLIMIGLIAALTVNWQRYQVEQSNNTVEMVMDYEDIVELAQVEGVPVHSLMQQFREAGITSLAVYETTLEKLNKSGKVTAVSGAQLLHQYRIGSLDDPTWKDLVDKGIIRAEDVYIVGQDERVFAEVYSDLVRRLSPDRVTELSDGSRPVLAVKANFEKVVKWNLGMPTDEMKEASSQGFYVVARPTNYTKVRPEDVDAVFSRLDSVPNVSAVMFVGSEALGYPGQLARVVDHMKQRGITLAMIEHPLQLQFVKQEGLPQIAAALDYQAARVYSIPKDEQPKLKLAEAVQRWAVTDQERNIRMNVLRSFDKPEPSKNLIETNIDYISGVKEGLLEQGYTLGRAGTFSPYFPNKALLSLALVGATAAGVLILTLIKPFAARRQYILLIILAAVLLVPVWKGGGLMVRQAAAMASAIVFPALAVTWRLDCWRRKAPHAGAPLTRIIVDGVRELIVTVLLSMIGGFYVGALLGDVRFLLEMEIYRGVKLTFIAPLVLVALAYLARYNLFDGREEQPSKVWHQLVKILDYPVYIKSLLVFAVAAVGAWVFIGRSGHTAGVPVPAVELKMRALLEQILYARPREKEFMIGHPAFFLAVMAVYRQWPKVLHFALVLVAAIGQGSLVETFAHIRTPVLMSTIRGLDGLAAGIAFGILAVIGVQVLRGLSFLLGRRPA